MFNMKKIIISLLVIAAAGMTWYLVKSYKEEAIYKNPAFASGNGRLEATEINIAAKLAGKIEKILVDEGDYVKAGQTLVQMQTNTLEAELAQAEAQIEVKKAELAQAEAEVEVEKAALDSANADLKAYEAALTSSKAELMGKESILKNAESEYERAKNLSIGNTISEKEFEAKETAFRTAKANYDSAEASVRKAESNLESGKAAVAKAEASLKSGQAAVKRAQAAIDAAKADADRTRADIADSSLTAPREGRIQYRIAEEFEVLSSGGRVLNLVDLTDVYLTFFVPEEVAGKIAVGADARIVLDAMDDIAIPATISYVASVAQFTPKSVETRVEREKLMFRVKAKIDPALLKQYVEYVKTGIPGVAWVRLDDKEPWPDFLKTPKEKGEPLDAGKSADAPADKPAETNETAEQ